MVLVAAEFLGSVGVGVTSPQFVRADNGKVYVVKTQNNQLGPKVLINEFLAARLGAYLGLCFPASDIIIVGDQPTSAGSWPAPTVVSPGRHFASQYLDGAEYVNKHNLNKAANIAEMAGVMLFDHMFHNPDRTHNRKNLLLRSEGDKYRIYAIDNSHLFRSGRWTIELVNNLSRKLKVYYRYSFGLLLRDRLYSQDFRPYLDKVAKLDDAQIDDLVQEIPAEWLTDDAEQRALVEYIRTRRNLAEEIWEKLCKYIPKARGGRSWLHGRASCRPLPAE